MNKQVAINYLRTFRRRAGMSQEEVAFLLGSLEGTSVSRHEQSLRVPLLRAALMYEFLYEASVKDLFPAVFQEARGAVRDRAYGVRKSLLRRKPSARRDRKLAALRRLIGEHASQ